MILSDGVALITGGGSGIGKHLCIALAQEGMQVIVVDINEDRAKSVADKIGSGAHPYKADVTSREEMQSLAVKIEREYGKLNLLCANAGVVMPWGSVINREMNDWMFVLSVNLFGAIHTIDAFLPLIRQGSERAHIMITSSSGGLRVEGHVPLGPYTVSKYACVGYAEELRKALEDENIGVSLLCPGLILTPILETSAETRPASLGSQNAPTPERVTSELTSMGIRPRQAAEVAIKGIKENRFYIPTHCNAYEKLKPHYEAILAELSEQGVETGRN